MVIVDTTFSRIQELLKKKISVRELEETLADMGMELNAVEKDEIKIEITAERTDLITTEGLARAINCYKKFVPKYEEIKVQKSNYVHIVDPVVKKYRGYTRSFVVKGLELNSEKIQVLMQVQEKIHDTFGRKRKKVAIGVYDLEKIHFPVTYTAKKPEEIKFVALGMSEELSAKKILLEHPTGKLYAHLLSGMDKYSLQIDAKKQILSLPPIINSNNLGKIVSETRNVFVECTGPNEEALDEIMNILATMFYDWGGAVYSVTIKDSEKNHLCPSLEAQKRKINLGVMKTLIGIEVKSSEAKGYLQQMEYSVVDGGKDKEILTVSIPSVRTDIWHEVDIADDIARAYGYNNIKPTLPNISTIGKMLPRNILVEDLRNFLTGLGLLEVKTFALTNHNHQYEKMNIAPGKCITLGKNTADKNLSMVRSWMIPEALKALVANRNKEYPQNIFEVGFVVVPDAKVDVRARNVEKLVCLLCEDKADFTRVKQVLNGVMEFLGKKCIVKEIKPAYFIAGRAGGVYCDGKEIGVIGEIAPEVLEKWGLTVPVAALEMELEDFFRL